MCSIDISLLGSVTSTDSGLGFYDVANGASGGAPANAEPGLGDFSRRRNSSPRVGNHHRRPSGPSKYPVNNVQHSGTLTHNVHHTGKARTPLSPPATPTSGSGMLHQHSGVPLDQMPSGPARSAAPLSHHFTARMLAASAHHAPPPLPPHKTSRSGGKASGESQSTPKRATIPTYYVTEDDEEDGKDIARYYITQYGCIRLALAEFLIGLQRQIAYIKQQERACVHVSLISCIFPFR